MRNTSKSEFPNKSLRKSHNHDKTMLASIENTRSLYGSKKPSINRKEP